MALSQDIHPRKKVLSLFTLIMINVIAVDSLRNLAIGAEYGFSLVFFYAVACVSFFIPIVLVAAELATGWPKIGGVYVWVKEAFGERWGLVVIWLQWIYNVVWFPTILAFIAASLSFLIDPALATHKAYMLSIMLAIFWAATLGNCFGMKISALISTFGAIIGTLLPMLVIICLGIGWLLTGQKSVISFTWHDLLPHINDIHDLAFFVAILFGLLGMEMSAVHAEDVSNPQKNYPRALLISSILIFVSLVGASLAITMVIPHQKLSLVTGLGDAFHVFFTQFNLEWMEPIIIIAIIIGAICSVSAWIIGPTKGLLAAAEDGCLPHIFRYTTSNGAPISLLILQGIIFTVLCSIILFMPSIDSSYWILSALTAQLAMFVYIFMFAAAIKLRYRQPNVKRTYSVPGGRLGIWMVSLLGTLTCAFAIVIGFFPPHDMIIDSMVGYDMILGGGMFIFCGLPLILYRRQEHHT